MPGSPHSASELAKQVGLLIQGKVPGPVLDDDSRRLLNEGTMSGVVLFKENATDLEQLVELVDQIHKASAAQVIVSVDQEGGAVQRFDHVLTPLPSAAALGQRGPQAAALAAYLSARQLAGVGINMVLAPVLDVNTNPANPIIGTRAFGSDVGTVAACGAACARAYMAGGVIPVGKHFPGHGDTALDSHLELPTIEHDRERLETIEFEPFRRCVERLPAMLSAHVWVKAFDAEKIPASMSKSVSLELLRKEIGFSGLVLTDDLFMKGVTNGWSVEEACLLAFEAGADQLLVCGNAAAIESAHSALVAAFESGRLSREQLEASLARRQHALQLLETQSKKQYSPDALATLLGTSTAELSSLCDLPNIWPGANDVSVASRVEALKKHIAACYDLAFKLASNGLTMDADDPLYAFAEGKRILFLIPDHPRYRLDFEQALADCPDRGAHSAGSQQFEFLRYPFQATADDIAGLAKAASGRVLWLVTFRAVINRQQLALAAALSAAGDLRLVAASDLPGDLLSFDFGKVLVAIRDPSDLGVRSFWQRIFIRADEELRRTVSGASRRGPIAGESDDV